MKTLPIPQAGAAVSTDLGARVKDLEQRMSIVARNFQDLGKRSIDSRNVRDEAIQLRHLAAEVLALIEDLIENLIGDATSRARWLAPRVPAQVDMQEILATQIFGG